MKISTSQIITLIIIVIALTACTPASTPPVDIDQEEQALTLTLFATETPFPTETLTPTKTPIPPTPTFPAPEGADLPDSAVRSVNEQGQEVILDESGGDVLWTLVEDESGEEWQPALSEVGLLLQEWSDPATSVERQAEISKLLAEQINNSEAEVKVEIGGKELVFVAHWWDDKNPFYREFNLNPRTAANYLEGQWVPKDEVTPEYAAQVVEDWPVTEAAKEVNGQHYRLDADSGEWMPVATTMTIPGWGEVDIVDLAVEILVDPQAVMAKLTQQVVTQATGTRDVERERYTQPRSPMLPYPAVVVGSLADHQERETAGLYQELMGGASGSVMELGDSGQVSSSEITLDLRLPLVVLETDPETGQKRGRVLQWLVAHQGLGIVYCDSFIIESGEVRYFPLLGEPSSTELGGVPGEVGLLVFYKELVEELLVVTPTLFDQSGVGSNAELTELVELTSQGELEEAIALLKSFGLFMPSAGGSVINR